MKEDSFFIDFPTPSSKFSHFSVTVVAWDRSEAASSMTMEPRKSKKIKVLMLPWLGHGHVTPFMELAKKLSRRDLQIYFCSTPVILGSLKKKKKFSRDDDSIEFVEFHLPSSPELPPDRHTTNGLPSHLMPSLKEAFDMAGPSFSSILETLKPDLIIQDYNQLPATAVKYDIPTVRFISTGATVGAFFIHRIQKPDVEFPFPEIRLGEFHEKQFQDMIRPFTNGRARSDSSPVALKTTTLFNTFRELEGNGSFVYNFWIRLEYVRPSNPLGISGWSHRIDSY